ncbi:MAG TPA: EAL domain-containing protein, partial [Euzebya sp.]|nr:EAL domain-containing protein [Euzebya sp.]
MNESAAAIATQQLAEFLARLMVVPDSPTATRMTAERAARALDAEVGVVIIGSVVATAMGFQAGRVPEAALLDVAAGRRSVLDVPGAGSCSTLVAPIGGSQPGHLVVARSGDEGFLVDEVSLVRGMARVLELRVDALRTLEAERRQAAENVRLVASLQERQRLMEQLSEIQRAIARRTPLQQILDTITAGAQELLGDEVVALRLRDTDEEEMLLLMSSRGLPPEVARWMWRLPASDSGVAGRAMRSDDLVIIERYAESPEGMAHLEGEHVQAAMAVPVHDSGAVVGALVIASHQQDRVYSARDQQVLRAFAEHVSLAVTDAETVKAMHQAFHDPLTGLASRKLFIDRLEHGVTVAQREGGRLAVLFMDLDRFKVVNDSLGHAAGDDLLVGVAQRLRACLRASDTIARFGGDEFAIIIHEPADGFPAVVAERIIEAVRAPFRLHGREVSVGCSIGIAMGNDQKDAKELLRRADMAMYEAKRGGKGQYALFDASMQGTAAPPSFDLEIDLRGAVERDEFVIHYQPILALGTGQVTGTEALVRWQHPRRGLIPPLDFIPVAEESELIVQIGGHVLREACRQTAAWNRRRFAAGLSPLMVHVNLSARQIRQEDLADVVAAAVTDAKLDPSVLVLEITESALIHDTPVVAQRLRQLKALGLRVAVDDFGTGYSSLTHLHQFPVDIIKIDKSFVAGIG